METIEKAGVEDIIVKKYNDGDSWFGSWFGLKDDYVTFKDVI